MHSTRTKIKLKQYFPEKTSSSASEGFQSHVEQNRLDVQYVNACMHVDTGTDLDLVSHFVGPQSGDKSILGTVSSLKQGSQQDTLKKWFVHSQITIQDEHFGCTLV